MNAEMIVYPKDSHVAISGGQVVPIGRQQMTPQQILARIKETVGMQYMGRDVEKIGMTLLEAAMYEAAKKASEGDLDALEKLLNRLMGKPVQQVISATGSFKDFLDMVANSSEPREVDPFGD